RTQTGHARDACLGAEELQRWPEAVRAVGAAPLAYLPRTAPGQRAVGHVVEALHVVQVLTLGEVARAEQAGTCHGADEHGILSIAVVFRHHVLRAAAALRTAHRRNELLTLARVYSRRNFTEHAH